MKGSQEKDQLPRVVVIGGGTGLSVMLRGLKEKPLDITAIVTVADDGGSSGILRSELQIPPPGDIRNVLIALADVEPLLSQMLQYRFREDGTLAGHSLGNLILAAMTEITGDFLSGVRELSRVFAVRGRVLPSSAQAIELVAEMEDGSVIVGESKIPMAGKKIRRVYIDKPNIAPLEEAVQAIQGADAIIVGPGSLYTSILPNLLIPKMAQTLIASKALKIFVCNVMTQPGETDGYSVGDHLQALYDHIGDPAFDYIIANNGEISREVQEQYAEKGAAAVRLDWERVAGNGGKIVADQFVLYQTYLRHDAEKLSNHIHELVSERISKKG